MATTTKNPTDGAPPSDLDGGRGELGPDERSERVSSLFGAIASETPTSVRERAADLAERFVRDSERLPLAEGDGAGPYEIIDVLGSGGQAVVYRAKHRQLGRQVALKVPRREVAERLLKEAKLAAGLEHAAIARVEDVQLDGEVPYMVMELCEGGSLETLLEKHRDGLPIARVVEISRAVLAALQTAHAAGIVHRDVKPANILFDAHGKAKVGDFGIGTVATAPEVSHSLEVSHATRLAGTPLFMAPEQEDPSLREGARLDGRADLFAFGKVLFQMLTGASPRTVRPPSRLRDDLPEPWDLFVFKLLEERPGDRFADAAEALEEIGQLEALEAWEDAPRRRRRGQRTPSEPSATTSTATEEPADRGPTRAAGPIAPPIDVVDPFGAGRARAAGWVLGVMLSLAGYFMFAGGLLEGNSDTALLVVSGLGVVLAGLATFALGKQGRRAERPRAWPVLIGGVGSAVFFVGLALTTPFLDLLDGTGSSDWARYGDAKLRLLLFGGVPMTVVGALLAGSAWRTLRPGPPRRGSDRVVSLALALFPALLIGVFAGGTAIVTDHLRGEERIRREQRALRVDAKTDFELAWSAYEERKRGLRDHDLGITERQGADELLAVAIEALEAAERYRAIVDRRNWREYYHGTEPRKHVAKAALAVGDAAVRVGQLDLAERAFEKALATRVEDYQARTGLATVQEHRRLERPDAR